MFNLHWSKGCSIWPPKLDPASAPHQESSGCISSTPKLQLNAHLLNTHLLQWAATAMSTRQRAGGNTAMASKILCITALLKELNCLCCTGFFHSALSSSMWLVPQLMVPVAVKTVALCSLMLLNAPVFPKDLGPACSSVILTSRPIKGCSDGGGNGGFSSSACSVCCMFFFILTSSFLPTPSEPFFMLPFFRSLAFADGLVFKLAFAFADGFFCDAFLFCQPFFPRASERRVLPIVGVCKTSSHLHIFSSSHLLIFTSSHLPIFSSSHLLILTSSPHPSSSHLHIFSSSHLLIFTPSHLHIFSSSHLLIFTSSHPRIFSSSSHLHIFSSPHLLIFTSSHLHIFSHLLIFTSSHIFSHLLTSSHIFSHLHSHLLTSSHIFSHLLTSSHIFSHLHSHLLTSSHIFSHLLTPPLTSSHTSTHICSHLLTPPLTSSHIFSHLLTSSHICSSSHLLISHLLLLPSCPLALSFFSISLLKAGAGAVPTRRHETQPFRTK